MNVHQEQAFESNIEAHLLENGWHQVTPAALDQRGSIIVLRGTVKDSGVTVRMRRV